MADAQPTPAVAAHEGTFLVFSLADTDYAIEVARVREIIGALPITRVPCMPPAVLGVINLRGKVIPIVDLRLRFGLDPVDHGTRTCVVVVQSRGTEFGAVVDRVAEVARIAASEIEEPPTFGADIDTTYLSGIAKTGARVRLLLDIDRALSPSEFLALDAARAGAA